MNKLEQMIKVALAGRIMGTLNGHGLGPQVPYFAEVLHAIAKSAEVMDPSDPQTLATSYQVLHRELGIELDAETLKNLNEAAPKIHAALKGAKSREEGMAASMKIAEEAELLASRGSQEEAAASINAALDQFLGEAEVVH